MPSKKVQNDLVSKDPLKRLDGLEKVAEEEFDREWFEVVNHIAHWDKHQSVRLVAARVVAIAQELIERRQALRDQLEKARAELDSDGDTQDIAIPDDEAESTDFALDESVLGEDPILAPDLDPGAGVDDEA